MRHDFRHIIFLWMVILAFCRCGAAAPPAGQWQAHLITDGVHWDNGLNQQANDQWELVWSDEFAGEGAVRPENWDFEHGYVRNGELQYYQPQNAVVKDGFLTIEARREGAKDSYTSASLVTKGKHEFTYGKFEARMRINPGLGSWPAFWTLGRKIESQGWPACGEIDIMEYYQSKVLANVCRPQGGSCDWHSSVKTAGQLGGASWFDAFHDWVMEWDAQRIDLYLDGDLLTHFDVESATGTYGSNPFREPHYLILNQAIGGQNGGDPKNTPFPLRLEVDYVRVYQQKAAP